MLIRVMSDLHLEFSQGNMHVPELPDDAKTVLILAGDIGLVKKTHTFIDFITDMSARFQDVIYVMGNHEHYKVHFLLLEADYMQTYFHLLMYIF